MNEDKEKNTKKRPHQKSIDKGPLKEDHYNQYGEKNDERKVRRASKKEE